MPAGGSFVIMRVDWGTYEITYRIDIEFFSIYNEKKRWYGICSQVF